MRRHPLIGGHILESMGGLFCCLAPVVRAYHERWDGSGYPRGLREQEIPLPSRVLSVVDAYDAMTSRRPYKEALSPRAIEAELRQSSGSQFDPGVVLAFLSVLEDPTPGQVCPETDLDWNSLLSANPSQGVFPL